MVLRLGRGQVKEAKLTGRIVGAWLLLMEEWGRLGARMELLEGKGRWSLWRRLTVA